MLTYNVTQMKWVVWRCMTFPVWYVQFSVVILLKPLNHDVCGEKGVVPLVQAIINFFYHIGYCCDNSDYAVTRSLAVPLALGALHTVCNACGGSGSSAYTPDAALCLIRLCLRQPYGVWNGDMIKKVSPLKVFLTVTNIKILRTTEPFWYKIDIILNRIWLEFLQNKIQGNSERTLKCLSKILHQCRLLREKKRMKFVNPSLLVRKTSVRFFLIFVS